MFVYRRSQHIESDIKRNWSSWSFGQQGFEGTKDQLDLSISKITDTSPLFISGFEIYPHNLKESEFGELYKNYWVLKDTRNYGLSCIELNSEKLQDAIIESKKIGVLGDGENFDAEEAQLVWSEGEHHIFKI